MSKFSSFGLLSKAFFAWFLLSLGVFLISGGYNLLLYVFLFVFVYGGLMYYYRTKVKAFLFSLPFKGFAKFLLAAIIISVFEEVLCLVTGNELAHPVLIIDLYLVVPVFSVWFTFWYFLLKRYYFTENEILFLAGLNGFIFEFSGDNFSNPVNSLLIGLPLVSFVYMAVFFVPYLLINRTGQNKSWIKYVLGLLGPYALSVPVVIILYVLSGVLGITI